jgi:hypothetical protein
MSAPRGNANASAGDRGEREKLTDGGGYHATAVPQGSSQVAAERSAR